MAAGDNVKKCEDLVAMLESALQKVNAAANLGHVKVQRTEANLFGLLPEVRDIMLKALQDTSDTDRARLIMLFGGDCTRLVRIRAVLDAMSYSVKAVAEDKRAKETFSTCVRALESVEAVLKDLGQGKTKGEESDRTKETALCQQAKQEKQEPARVCVEAEISPDSSPLDHATSVALDPGRSTAQEDPEHTRVVDAIDSGKLRDMALRAFSAQDTARSGLLDWNSGKIRNFITQTISELRISVSPTELQIYSMYDRFDKQGKWGLNLEDCVNLLEAISCSLLGLNMSKYRAKAALTSREQLRGLTRALFEKVRAGRSGISALDWNSGEIRAFTREIFKTLRLPTPSDACISAMYAAFDAERSGALGLDDCDKLAETLLLHSIDQVKDADDDTFCGAGHVMQLIVTEVSGHRCAICGGAFRDKVCIWLCQPCDYRMCVRCHKDRRKERSEQP
jgi:hypothetical protein